MKNIMRFATTSIIAIGLAAGIGFAAHAEDSSDAIKIVTNDWTSQNVLSNIVGQLLEKMGDTVEYRSSDGQLQYTAIANNDMDFQVEVWEGSQGEAFTKAMKEGLVDLGTHEAITREDWWYPAYVKDICPGLPDWKDSMHALRSSQRLKPAARAASSVRRQHGASTTPSVFRL